MSGTTRHYTLTRLLAAIWMACTSVFAWADYSKATHEYDMGNFAVAIKEFTKLANQGHMEAQFRLGEIYKKGIGVKRDVPKAISWYGKAAEQGSIKAQLTLGTMYGRGVSVKQNYVLAYYWYHLASDQCDINGTVLRDYLVKHMTIEELTEGRARISLRKQRKDCRLEQEQIKEHKIKDTQLAILLSKLDSERGSPKKRIFRKMAAKLEAERKAREEAQHQAKLEAERKAREEVAQQRVQRLESVSNESDSVAVPSREIVIQLFVSGFNQAAIEYTQRLRQNFSEERVIHTRSLVSIEDVEVTNKGSNRFLAHIRYTMRKAYSGDKPPHPVQDSQWVHIKYADGEYQVIQTNY